MILWIENRRSNRQIKYLKKFNLSATFCTDWVCYIASVRISRIEKPSWDCFEPGTANVKKTEKGIKMKKTIIGILTAGMILATAAVIHAEEAGNPGDGDWRITLGAGAGYGPISPGVDETELDILPYVDIEYKNRFFINARRGVGVYLLQPQNRPEYTVGVAIGYDGGRDEDDAKAQLQGLGDIDGSAEAIIFGELEIGMVDFELELAQGLGSDGHDGFRAELSAEIGGMVTDRIHLGAGPFITYGDGQYIKSYYGVTTEQAGRSERHSQYDTDGGFESYGLGLNARYRITQHWSVIGLADYTRLMGDAKDSPIVENKGFFGGGIVLAYTF